LKRRLFIRHTSKTMAAGERLERLREALVAQDFDVIVDEAAQLGTLPQLRQAVTLLRGNDSSEAVFDLDESEMLLQIAGEPAKCARRPDPLHCELQEGS
jgi:hypothetical protein